MTQELLQKYVDEKLVTRKYAWYYIGNDALGNGKANALEGLKKAIAEGKLPDLNQAQNNDDQKTDNDQSPKGTQLKPISKTVNPALKATDKDQSDKVPDLYSSMTKDLGDIKRARKGGRFVVYIHGIDSRKKEHPLVEACPFEFRYNDKKRNVKSGNSTLNEGWTVLSKSKIDIDPRTGRKWLEASTDHTPDEDFITVNNYVLCYADKKQFKEKKGKMVMENLIMTTKVADSRQEASEQLAKASKVDPSKGIQGYINSNAAEHSKAKEHLMKNEKFTSHEAQEHIDNLNAMGTREIDIDTEVANLAKAVNAGKIGKTLKSTQAMSIDDI